MKSIKDLREQYDLITEKDESEMNKLSSLVRAGLFDAKKLPALKKALDKSADKISGQEKRMLINLLDSLMDQVLSNQSVYQKVKQNVMKEEYVELDEGKLDPTTRDINDLPNIIMLRRRAIRTFPGGGKVVMYWADKINRYIPIPVDPINTVTRGPSIENLNEATYDFLHNKYLEHIHNAYSTEDEDDPERAIHLSKANRFLHHAKNAAEAEALKSSPRDPSAAKKAGKEAKIRLQALGKKVQKTAEGQRMTNLRKKAGGEYGYVSQAGEFAKSGKRAAALGTLAGGLVGSLARKMVKEGLETTRIKMKKMSVSPLTGVRKNAVIREDFRTNLEEARSYGAADAAADAASFIPGPVGSVASLASAGLSLSRGDYAGAALDAAGALPLVGYAAKAAKVAKLTNAARKIAKVSKIGKIAKASKIGKAGKLISKTSKISNALSSLDGYNSNNSSPSNTNYQTQRREIGRTSGESSFKQARVGDYATRQARDTQLQRKAFQYNENTISLLKTISEGESKVISLNDGNDINVNHTLAKKIINIYESLNKNNKQAMANMLDESIDNFKKISKFALDNGN